MSTEYAQEGNQQGSSLSTTSGDEMSDDQTKINLSLSNSSTSPRASPLTRHELIKDQMSVPLRPHHSFSIDALVGNSKSCEATINKGTDHTAEAWNNHNLIDLKRIQSYYQQLYNQNVSFKQSNNYIYPHQSGVPDNGAKIADSSQQDQLLSYYTNLYLQSSSFYQDRYFESLKELSTNNSILQNNSKEFRTELNHRFDKEKTLSEESTADTLTQRKLQNQNENKDSSHVSQNDSLQTERFIGSLNQPGDHLFSTSMSPKTTSPCNLRSQAQSTPLYSSIEKSVNLTVSGQSGVRSSFSQPFFGQQSLTSSLNGSNFYPPYCGK